MIDPDAFGRGLRNSYGFVNGIATDVRQGIQQNERKSALSQYAMNPNDPNAINALARVDGALAMQAQDRQAMLAERQRNTKQQGLEAHRENIVKGAQIVRQIQPKDQAGWDRALTIAQRMGMNTTEIPKHWNDPQTQQYAQNLIAVADAFEPQKAEASQYQVVAGQPGAGVYRFDKRAGSIDTLVKPNDGTQPMGAPAVEGPASNVPTVTDQATYDAVPAGQSYRTPDGLVRQKPGGQSQPATGGFLDPLSPR